MKVYDRAGSVLVAAQTRGEFYAERCVPDVPHVDRRRPPKRCASCGAAAAYLCIYCQPFWDR